MGERGKESQLFEFMESLYIYILLLLCFFFKKSRISCILENKIRTQIKQSREKKRGGIYDEPLMGLH